MKCAARERAAQYVSFQIQILAQDALGQEVIERTQRELHGKHRGKHQVYPRRCAQCDLSENIPQVQSDQRGD